MNLAARWLFDIGGRLLRTLDWPLCVALAGLMAIGLAVLYSAGGDSTSLVLAQGARYAVGFAAAWALSRVPPHRLRNATPLAYLLVAQLNQFRKYRTHYPVATARAAGVDVAA